VGWLFMADDHTFCLIACASIILPTIYLQFIFGRTEALFVSSFWESSTASTMNRPVCLIPLLEKR